MRRKLADTLFAIGLALTQVIAVIFYAVYQTTIYNGTELGAEVDANIFRYPYFQDIHVMIYIGFGFLLTFIHRHRLSSLTMCFWVAALAIQYYFLFAAMWKNVFGPYEDIIITPERLILGEVSGAAALIALSAIIGKTNNLQFLVITIFSALLFTLNEEICIFVLGGRDVGGGMIIHAFGAFYGLGLTIFINYKKSRNNINFSARHSSLTTAMIGTLFLWCFWPSFNAALATTPSEVFLAVINTYFSIIGSVIAAYFTTLLIDGGKFAMDPILNATLAGGVVMGAGADLLFRSYVAYIVGLLIGILSTLMFHYSPRLLNRFGIYDVAGVMNLHGIPGLIGGLLSAIYRQVYVDDRGAIQVAVAFISVGIGLVGGLVVGFVVRGFTFYETENEFFNDLVNVAVEDEMREKLEIYNPPHAPRSGSEIGQAGNGVPLTVSLAGPNNEGVHFMRTDPVDNLMTPTTNQPMFRTAHNKTNNLPALD